MIFNLKFEYYVTFLGASCARDATPSMMAYGLAKAAIHQFTLTLASPEAGLPSDILVIAILPITIDTLLNRQQVPNGDVSAWTPTKYIVDLLYKWITTEQKPKNGSLVQFTTRNFNTEVTYY